MPDSEPSSEFDFAIARRAVERGWVSKEQVEAALSLRDKDPGLRIVRLLPLTPDQLRELESAGSRPVPPEAEEAMADPARQVGRRYCKVNFLKEGGMGLVFRGWDRDLHRWVALKFLKQIGDETARAYFRREAQLAAGLDHPNIAKIYEIGEHDGRPFIAMQYVDGETLATARERLRMDQKVEAVLATAQAVAYAHERGVIHRDLKPANVMIEGTGVRGQGYGAPSPLIADPFQVYVMDFGLAKETTVPDSSLTGTNVVVGTPSYLAPEQARGKADAQSDVYSLGATFYELATGRPPFVGETSSDVLAQVLTKEVIWPGKLSPHLSEDAEAVILHAMEKEKKRRYIDARELVEDLESLRRRNPLRHARRPTLAYVLGLKVRKQPLPWAFGTALVLAVVGGAIFGTAQLIRAKRGAERLAVERQRAARREAGLHALATLWYAIVERKQEMRSGRVPPEMARERLGESVGEVGRYIADWPSEPQGYYIRARGRFYLGDLDSAESDLRSALDAAPDFRPGWALLGMAQVERYRQKLIGPEDYFHERQQEYRGLLEEGIRALEKGWEAGREREEAARWGLPWSREDQVAGRVAQALMAHFRDGNADRAASILIEGAEEYASEEYLLHAALLTPNADTRITLLNRAVTLAPGYEAAYFMRGLSRYKKGEWEKAVADYDTALTLWKEAAWIYVNRGNAKYAARDFEGALRDYDRAVELKPDWPSTYQNRGALKVDLGKYDDAIGDFDRALSLQRNLAEALQGRASAKLRKGDPEGAIADCERALQIRKEYPSALCTRGRARLEKGQVDEAIADFDQVVILKPDFAEAYYERGRAKSGKKEWAAAREDCDQALAIDADLPEPYLLRGVAKYILKDYEGAVADYTRAVELRSDWAEAYLGRAQAKRAIDDRPGAIADYGSAIRIRDDLPTAHQGRAEAHFEPGHWRESIADFDWVIRRDPNPADALLNRGRAKQQLQDLDGAIADFTLAIDLVPRSPSLRHFRGLARLEAEDFDGAIADFEKALELAPAPWSHQETVRGALEEARRRKGK